MLRTSVRAAATAAFLALTVGSAAHADGQVTNAISLWTGYLRSSYDDTLEYVAAGNTDDGGKAAANLMQYAEQMNQQTSAIHSAAGSLAQELATAWGDTRQAMSTFSDTAETISGQVGNTQVDLDDLESAFEAADTEFDESLTFTRNFGTQFGAILVGPVENAKVLFQGAVTTHYQATTQYIANGNIAAAKAEMEKLRDVTFKLAELAIDIKNKSTPLARRLIEIWQPADDAIKQFQVEVGVIQSSLGKATVSLSLIDSLYGNVNAEIVRAHKDFQTFGESLSAIDDEWE